MQKAREILRLKKAGHSLTDSAKSIGRGKTTVSEVLSQAENSHLLYPIDLSDAEYMSKLYTTTI